MDRYLAALAERGVGVGFDDGAPAPAVAFPGPGRPPVLILPSRFAAPGVGADTLPAPADVAAHVSDGQRLVAGLGVPRTTSERYSGSGSVSERVLVTY